MATSYLIHNVVSAEVLERWKLPDLVSHPEGKQLPSSYCTTIWIQTEDGEIHEVALFGAKPVEFQTASRIKAT